MNLRQPASYARCLGPGGGGGVFGQNDIELVDREEDGPDHEGDQDGPGEVVRCADHVRAWQVAAQRWLIALVPIGGCRCAHVLGNPASPFPIPGVTAINRVAVAPGTEGLPAVMAARWNGSQATGGYR